MTQGTTFTVWLPEPTDLKMAELVRLFKSGKCEIIDLELCRTECEGSIK